MLIFASILPLQYLLLLADDGKKNLCIFVLTSNVKFSATWGITIAALVGILDSIDSYTLSTTLTAAEIAF